jgi:hypothetical protein
VWIFTQVRINTFLVNFDLYIIARGEYWPYEKSQSRQTKRIVKEKYTKPENVTSLKVPRINVGELDIM